MLSVTLRQMEYACAIGRNGGLTAAAAALHVSQPALSVALAQIERALGQPVFLRRSGGPMVPTPFGRVWLVEAEACLSGVARLMSGTLKPAPLRLAVFEDLAPLVLAPLLADFGPQISAQVMGFTALTEALSLGHVDLALTWDLGLSPQMQRSVLHALPPHAVLASDHPLARRASLTLADLADEALVLTDQGLSVGHMRALFSRVGLTPRVAHRCATLDLMRSYAAHGLGVGLSYSQPVPRFSPDGKALVVVAVTDAGTEPVVLVRLAVGPPPPGYAALLAALIPLISSQPPPMTPRQP